MKLLNLSEAEPDEVVEHGKEDCQDEEEDGQEDEVGGLGGDGGEGGIAVEHLTSVTGQVPTEFSIQRFCNKNKEVLNEKKCKWSRDKIKYSFELMGVRRNNRKGAKNFQEGGGKSPKKQPK